MAPGKGLKSYFGIDNENREYSSTKTYSIEEIQKLGGKINQDYIDYLKNPDGGELIPSPLKYSFDTASQKAVSLPAKYDLRDYGYVSTVKDQGFLGSCWAHAALASLESNTLKNTAQATGYSALIKPSKRELRAQRASLHPAEKKPSNSLHRAVPNTPSLSVKAHRERFIRPSAQCSQAADRA